MWTAAEFDQLTPAQQQQIVQASFTTDVSDVPEEFIELVRRRLRQHIETEEHRDRR